MTQVLHQKKFWQQEQNLEQDLVIKLKWEVKEVKEENNTPIINHMEMMTKN